jgi:formate-dependent nitrite reductase membrane component NrfD
MWAQRNETVHGGGAIYPPDHPLLQKNALAAYDVSHARPWGWQVPAYCWTKSIGSGALAVPAIAMLFGRLGADRMRDVVLSSIALLFTAITTVLLVADLEHPARFLRVVFSPQSRSWLARGAFVLIGYSGLAGLFWLAAIMGMSSVSAVLLWPTVLVGFFAACYTAFLFGQCEGRDLWQTPLLAVHLIVQALMCGAAAMALLPAAIAGSSAGLEVARVGLIAGLISHLVIVGAEFMMPHSTDNAAYAARLITYGPFKLLFWGGAVFVGGILPLCLLLLLPISLASSAVLSLLGLLAFEWCFVMAGQSVPNS